MKLIVLNCPSCGGSLEIDPSCRQVYCSYCGAQIFVDDEVQRVEHVVDYGDVEDAGYRFEKGRQRAIAEAAQRPADQPAAQPTPAKKRRTWLWVLGWIFVFPVPLTIIMLKKKDMKPIIRYAIIVIAWIIYIGWVNTPSNSKNKTERTSSEVVATQREEYSDFEEELEEELEEEAADAEDEKVDEKAAPTSARCTVQLVIDCKRNLALSKYDVEIEVDGEKVGSVRHGDLEELELSLTKGEHKLVCKKKGANKPRGEISFDVEDDGDEFSYRITCKRNRIKIKEES